MTQTMRAKRFKYLQSRIVLQQQKLKAKERRMMRIANGSEDSTIWLRFKAWFLWTIKGV